MNHLKSFLTLKDTMNQNQKSKKKHIVSVTKHFISCSTKITCWMATEYDKPETFSSLLKILQLNSLNKDIIRSRFFVTNPMTSMPNRIVLASSAVLIKEPELIEDVLKFLENFYENYFGGSKKDFSLDDLKTFKFINNIDNDVTKKIMKYATNLDDPLIKEIMKEDLELFSVYNDVDYDESILISLNGNSLKIPIKSDEISDKFEELISIELGERGERLYQLAKDNSTDSDVAKSVLAYSFIERKLIVSIDENLSNLLSISTFEFPKILKYVVIKIYIFFIFIVLLKLVMKKDQFFMLKQFLILLIEKDKSFHL